jgi:hypothetical protein
LCLQQQGTEFLCSRDGSQKQQDSSQQEGWVQRAGHFREYNMTFKAPPDMIGISSANQSILSQAMEGFEDSTSTESPLARVDNRLRRMIYSDLKRFTIAMYRKQNARLYKDRSKFLRAAKNRRFGAQEQNDPSER